MICCLTLGRVVRRIMLLMVQFAKNCEHQQLMCKKCRISGSRKAIEKSEPRMFSKIYGNARRITPNLCVGVGLHFSMVSVVGMKTTCSSKTIIPYDHEINEDSRKS